MMAAFFSSQMINENFQSFFFSDMMYKGALGFTTFLFIIGCCLRPAAGRGDTACAARSPGSRRSALGVGCRRVGSGPGVLPPSDRRGRPDSMGPNGVQLSLDITTRIIWSREKWETPAMQSISPLTYYSTFLPKTCLDPKCLDKFCPSRGRGPRKPAGEAAQTICERTPTPENEPGPGIEETWMEVGIWYSLTAAKDT
jgi:hypothetical protein